MASPMLVDTVRARVSLPPGLPRANPTASAWQEPPHPSVADAQSAQLPAAVDVAVIGSGITGCAVAHTLLHHGPPNLRVSVFEARRAVSGATGRNGGHLVSDAAALVPKVLAVAGADAARDVSLFGEANVARLRRLVAEELPPADAAAVELRDVAATAAVEDAALLAELHEGLRLLAEVHPDAAMPQRALAPADAVARHGYRPGIAGAMEQDGAAALWPYRLFTALLRGLLDAHADRFTLETHTPVEAVEHDAAAAPHPYTLRTPRGRVRAGLVVHCTNAHAGHLVPGLPGRLWPVRGTMSEQPPAPGFENRGERASWTYFYPSRFDDASGEFAVGMYYAQQNPRTGALWVGGDCQPLADMLSSDDSVCTAAARRSLCSVLPRIWSGAAAEGAAEGEGADGPRVWSGIMGFTADGLPLAGRLTRDLTGRGGDGEWLAAGFGGHGMNKCWLTGAAVAEMALGREPEAPLPAVFCLTPERVARMSSEQAVNMFC